VRRSETAEAASGGDWRWAGCSDNPDYGYKFTTTFIDARQREKNFPRHSTALKHMMMHLHNNEAGRLVRRSRRTLYYADLLGGRVGPLVAYDKLHNVLTCQDAADSLLSAR